MPATSGGTSDKNEPSQSYFSDITVVFKSSKYAIICLNEGRTYTFNTFYIMVIWHW